MRTRNRFLPVLLLVLAAFTLIAVTAPVANAFRRPPPVSMVIVDPGDPDDPAGDHKSAAPPSSGESIQAASNPSQACAPRAPVLKTNTAALATLHQGEWRLRDILFYVLFQSPLAR
jgi:hypothetical protein